MACEAFREDLQAYLDGEVAPPRRVALEAHLASCPKCAAVLEELEVVSASLARWRDRPPSDKFDFMMQFKLSNEAMPGEETQQADSGRPIRSQRPGTPPEPRKGLIRWITSDWRPAAAVVAGLALLVVVVAIRDLPGRARPLGRHTSVDMVRAFLDAGPAGQISEAYIYAANSGKRAIEADSLIASRAAASEVVYSFLASMDSPAERGAGWRLINLLSQKRTPEAPSASAHASMVAVLQGLLFTELHAATGESAALVAGRRFELQGRLREALVRYSTVGDGPDALRAKLAEGALRLRMGELDRAEQDLRAASKSTDAVVRNSALALIGEIENARRARALVMNSRQNAATAEQWHLVGIMEVRAYDFRSAASSFMKAATAAEAEMDESLAREARFRSAWCQKEIGQISTAAYGFRTLAGDNSATDELGYSAGIIEAVALSRLGRYEESVEACRQLLDGQPPDRAGHLEALCYFHMGYVQMRHLRDMDAASESFGRVASAGQGNLSFAAQQLLPSNTR